MLLLKRTLPAFILVQVFLNRERRLYSKISKRLRNSSVYTLNKLTKQMYEALSCIMTTKHLIAC